MKPAKKKRVVPPPIVHVGRSFDISQRKTLVVFNKFAALDQTDKQYILRQLKKMFPSAFRDAHV